MKLKLTEKQHRCYDIVISGLAILAVVLCVIDLSEGLLPWQRMLDTAILSVFVADYLLRLWSAGDKKQFVRRNIFDLVAILPFHTIFRVFKLARFGKALRLIKLPRIIALLRRPFRKAQLFFNINGFKYVALTTAIMIFFGGFLIQFAEGMSLPDGIWWAFVTTTTVGYGDISPSTFYGRLIAMVLMILGIGLIGTVTSNITSYFMHRGKPRNMSERTLEMIRDQLDHFDSLSEEDVDTICKVLKSLKKK